MSKFEQFLIEEKFDKKCNNAHKEGQQAYTSGKKQNENPYGHAGTYDYTDTGILRKNWSNGWNYAWLKHDRAERNKRHPDALESFSKITKGKDK